MVWTKWKTPTLFAGILGAGMTCGGWVYSQQVGSPSLPSGVNPADVVVVNEPGKPPQHCVLVKTTRLPNGQTAAEVRNLATNDVTTLIMMENVPSTSSTPDPRAKPTAAAWSPTASAPQPMPIVEEPAHSSKNTTKFQPMPTGLPVKAAQAAVPASTPAPLYRTVDEPNKPPVKCRVMAEWKTPEGHKAAQLQAVDNGEIMTMVEIAAIPGAANSKVTANLYHWNGSSTPPPGVPVPPLGASAKTTTYPSQNFMPNDNVVVMPHGSNVGNNNSQKPSLGDYVKNAWNGLFPGRSQTSAQASPPASSYKADPPRVIETTKTNDGSKQPNYVKVNDAAKSQPVSKTNDAVNAVDAPKPLDIPKIADTAKAIEMPKQIEKDRPNEGPKAPEAPKGLDAPKLPAVPTQPDYKSQWSPVDTKAPGFGKPATDAPKMDAKTNLPTMPNAAPGMPVPLPLPPAATEPSNPIPGLPTKSAVPGPVATPTLPSVPTPVKDAPALPSVPGAPQATLPSTPAPAVPSTAPVLPGLPGAQSTLPSAPLPVTGAKAIQTPAALAQASKAPALPPVGGAPVAAAGTWKKSDPLDSPEIFMPKRADDKMPSAASVGMAQATDSPRLAPGTGSVAAAANAADPRYLPASLPPSKPGMTPKTPESFDAVGFSNAFTTPETQQPQQPMMPQGNAGAPMSYRGPMPPNPVMAAQGYPMQMMPQAYAVPMMPYANPAMDRPGMPVSGSMSMQQCVSTLQSCIYPSQRELAVYQLGTCDWRSNPQVVQLLLTTAREDPAAMVRAAAVGTLGRMGVTTEAVQAACHQLKSDADPRVRQEAEQALIRCSGTNTGGGIQPVSGR